MGLPIFQSVLQMVALLLLLLVSPLEVVAELSSYILASQ